MEETSATRGGPPAERTERRGLDRCPYFHRTSVIMADGQVVTCANFYAEDAGRLDEDGPLSAIWNGPRLTRLRGDFGTADEWSQCKTCWFREIGYHTQREDWHNRQATDIEMPAEYSEAAWSFTHYLEDEGSR